MIKDFYYVNIAETKRMPQEQQQQHGWGMAAPSSSSRTMSFWCFSSSFAMRSLLKDNARCIVLTSGTLSPLNTFAQELMVGGCTSCRVLQVHKNAALCMLLPVFVLLHHILEIFKLLTFTPSTPSLLPAFATAG